MFDSHREHSRCARRSVQPACDGAEQQSIASENSVASPATGAGRSKSRSVAASPLPLLCGHVCDELEPERSRGPENKSRVRQLSIAFLETE